MGDGGKAECIWGHKRMITALTLKSGNMPKWTVGAPYFPASSTLKIQPLEGIADYPDLYFRNFQVTYKPH